MPAGFTVACSAAARCLNPSCSLTPRLHADHVRSLPTTEHFLKTHARLSQPIPILRQHETLERQPRRPFPSRSCQHGRHTPAVAPTKYVVLPFPPWGFVWPAFGASIGLCSSVSPPARRGQGQGKTERGTETKSSVTAGPLLCTTTEEGTCMAPKDNTR